jgi:hypothetical protein
MLKSESSSLVRKRINSDRDVHSVKSLDPNLNPLTTIADPKRRLNACAVYTELMAGIGRARAQSRACRCPCTRSCWSWRAGAATATPPAASGRSRTHQSYPIPPSKKLVIEVADRENMGAGVDLFQIFSRAPNKRTN